MQSTTDVWRLNICNSSARKSRMLMWLNCQKSHSNSRGKVEMARSENGTCKNNQ
jgi:hypothetical protein